MTRPGGPEPSAAVTIGQAAAFAGVTVKTVRHYHRLGLVPEPGRDHSGYRRYSSEALLQIVQVRTLAAAGVPLAEVGDLLDADPECFADALAEVDRGLGKQIEELVRRRVLLGRLAAGDRVLLPERASAILGRLADLGLDPAFVAVQQEALVLARAMAPEFFDGYLDQLEDRLDDPQHVELLQQGWEAESWGPDDPRLDDLATAMVQNLLADRDRLVLPAGFQDRPDSNARYAVLNHHRATQWPASARLTELIETKLREAGINVPHQ